MQPAAVPVSKRKRVCKLHRAFLPQTKMVLVHEKSGVLNSPIMKITANENDSIFVVF